MKAVCYDVFEAPPSLVTLPDPAPERDGVVLRVGATGICRSDWHGWMGHDPAIRLPHVPGHELAGTIVAVGADVRRWSTGDRVTMPFAGGCGCCPDCHAGQQQICRAGFQPGFTHWGSFAEFVAIRQADLNLVGLPDTLEFATAASLGCRVATAFRALVDQGRTRGGEWVAVHGCGGVGLAAIMIAQAIGARVVAVDIADDKLALARRLGAVATIDASEIDDVVAAIVDVTDGGAHVSMDALGHPRTCFDSIAGLRRRGRHLQVGLMLADQATPAVPMAKVIAEELEILGCHGMPAHRYDALLGMVEAGRLRPELLIGQHISLTDSIEALMGMDRFSAIGTTVVTRF